VGPGHGLRPAVYLNLASPHEADRQLAARGGGQDVRVMSAGEQGSLRLLPRGVVDALVRWQFVDPGTQRPEGRLRRWLSPGSPVYDTWGSWGETIGIGILLTLYGLTALVMVIAGVRSPGSYVVAWIACASVVFVISWAVADGVRRERRRCQ
jgi:hypothetical protein